MFHLKREKSAFEFNSESSYNEDGMLCSETDENLKKFDGLF